MIIAWSVTEWWLLCFPCTEWGWVGGIMAFACTGLVCTAGSLADPYSSHHSSLRISGHTRGKLKMEGWILTTVFCFHLRELGGIATHIFSFHNSVYCLSLQLINLFVKCKSRLNSVWNIEDSRRGLSVLAQDSMDLSPLWFGRSIGRAQTSMAGVESWKWKVFFLPRRGLVVDYLDSFPSLRVICYLRGVLPHGLILGNFISLVIITLHRKGCSTISGQ